MGQTRFRTPRFVLAAILPAALLVACGASTGAEHQGGAPAAADAGSAGSKAVGGSGSRAGSDSGGVSSGSSGASGSGDSHEHAGSSDTGGSAGQAGSSGASAGGGGGQPVACGSTICEASQYCVIPCCGGTAPMCFPAPSDGSMCPTGSHAGCRSNFGTCTSPANCCQYDDCTPPPPYCTEMKPQFCFPNPSVPGPPGPDRICQMMCA